MIQELKNKLIKLQSETLIKYINIATELICDQAPISEPSAAVITNQLELDKIADNNHSDKDTDKSNINKMSVAVKKLKINELITKEVNEAYKDYDILKKLDYITFYNKKVKYDENGIAINLADVISEIINKGAKENG